MEELKVYDYDDSEGVSPSDWTPVADTFFNWGWVQRSTTADKTFVIKNESEIYTANNATLVTATAGSDVFEQILFSFDGLVFLSELQLGDIPPGAYTSPITMRRVTRSNAVTGSYTVVLSAESWV